MVIHHWPNGIGAPWRTEATLKFGFWHGSVRFSLKKINQIPVEKVTRAFSTGASHPNHRSTSA
jgi:hypothetical protein